MIRKAAATLASLGLIGGAGSVVYNDHGDATVKIKDKSGVVHTVHINGTGGKAFSCPGGTHDKVAPLDIKLGRVKLTLQQVRRSEHNLQLQYPNGAAPSSVVQRYNALVVRDAQLVGAYNAAVDEHNAIIDRLCTAN